MEINFIGVLESREKKNESNPSYKTLEKSRNRCTHKGKKLKIRGESEEEESQREWVCGIRNYRKTERGMEVLLVESRK